MICRVSCLSLVESGWLKNFMYFLRSNNLDLRFRKFFFAWWENWKWFSVKSIRTFLNSLKWDKECSNILINKNEKKKQSPDLHEEEPINPIHFNQFKVKSIYVNQKINFMFPLHCNMYNLPFKRWKSMSFILSPNYRCSPTWRLLLLRKIHKNRKTSNKTTQKLVVITRKKP